MYGVTQLFIDSPEAARVLLDMLQDKRMLPDYEDMVPHKWSSAGSTGKFRFFFVDLKTKKSVPSVARTNGLFYGEQ